MTAGQLPKIQVDLKTITNASDAAELAGNLVAALLPGHTAGDLTAHLVDLLGGAQASTAQLQQRTSVAAGMVLAAPIFQWH